MTERCVLRLAAYSLRKMTTASPSDTSCLTMRLSAFGPPFVWRAVVSAIPTEFGRGRAAKLPLRYPAYFRSKSSVCGPDSSTVAVSPDVAAFPNFSGIADFAGIGVPFSSIVASESRLTTVTL